MVSRSCLKKSGRENWALGTSPGLPRLCTWCVTLSSSCPHVLEGAAKLVPRQGKERSRRWGRRICLHPCRALNIRGPLELSAGGTCHRPTVPRKCLQAALTIRTHTWRRAETNWKRFHNSGLRKCTVALGWVPKSSLRLCFLLKP